MAAGIIDVIAVGRNIANPLLLALNASTTKIDEALELIFAMKDSLKSIIDLKCHEMNEVLQLLMGFHSLSPVAKPHYKRNKYLCYNDKQAILHLAMGDLRVADANDEINYLAWSRIKSALSAFKNDNKIKQLFKADTFYSYLFSLNGTELQRCCYLLYCCMQNIYLDLTRRLEVQSDAARSIKSNCSSNNDCCERGVGVRKYIKHAKPNISQQSNEEEAVATQNDTFDAFDGMKDCDEQECFRLINAWDQLNSYREKDRIIKAKKGKLCSEKQEKISNMLDSTHRKPLSIKTKKLLLIAKLIITILPDIPRSSVWQSWLSDEQIINNTYRYQLRKDWKKQY